MIRYAARPAEPRASREETMAVPETMRAARMHTIGGELKLETLPTPKPGDMDVLVRVRACGIVPNLGNILAKWPTWFPQMPQPPLPAVFGLDPAGEIAAVGRQVHNLKPGDRVYINPGRSCGTCRHCRGGDSISCKHYAFQGYFGFSEHAFQTFADYPIGGMTEYTVAPVPAIPFWSTASAAPWELRPQFSLRLSASGKSWAPDATASFCETSRHWRHRASKCSRLKMAASPSLPRNTPTARAWTPSWTVWGPAPSTAPSSKGSTACGAAASL